MRTYLYALNQVQLTYLAAANLKGRRLKSSVLQQSNILLKLKGTGKQKAKRIKVRVISEFSRSRGRFLKTAAATIYNVSPWYIYKKNLLNFHLKALLLSTSATAITEAIPEEQNLNVSHLKLYRKNN